jgi:hypothetical protein
MQLLDIPKRFESTLVVCKYMHALIIRMAVCVCP